MSSRAHDVVARRKLMFANGVPVRIATSFFRADLFADTRMSEPEFVRPSLQAAIEDLGYAFGRAEALAELTGLRYAALRVQAGESPEEALEDRLLPDEDPGDLDS